MNIKSAEFIISNTDLNKCPKPDKPEFAFIGRSNVGKSSLINLLTQRKDLAKTSGKPGKTQTINHFLVDKEWYLVDLPGYGYAGVSRTARKGWGKMIETYLLNRENLYCTFVLVDARHEPQKKDIEFITWLGEKQLPLCIILTKADKLSRVDLAKSEKQYKKKLLESWEELPPLFTTSAEKKIGREDVLDFIDKAIKGQL
ncbi:MAG TPA: ribosome biogenesis GTP-binding protein YihA/YsxC [Cyclobacteriaceae bacterium]|nr:ribosome biogenesis GTP-binding protein YihA/YsxC [Cyclobacteriaceae bacterium]HRK53520.1 ribosome biogenesis GTP-binding protein YihA/YsxC [Cyclobacteriaceae bacterium]